MARIYFAALAAVLFTRSCESFTSPTSSVSNVNAFGLNHDVVNYNPSNSKLMMGIMEDFLAGTDNENRKKNNDNYLAGLDKRVKAINDLEPEIEDLGDDELMAKTDEFRKRIQAGEDINGSIVEEAFAVVREAAWYVKNMCVHLFSHGSLSHN